MDLTFSEQEIAFRDELRGWFADERPGRRRRKATKIASMPGGGTSSAGSPTAAGPPCTGRASTAAAERR